MKRRHFLRTSAAGAAGAIAFPTIIPSSVRGADAPSNRLQIGAIGCGRIGRSADIPGTLKAGGVYVAVCDLDSQRAASGKQFIDDWCAKNKKAGAEIEVFGDYLEMLKRKDIDAVTVSTPDHWHAKPTVDAIRAGKHVYVQKPAGRLYVEGQAMVRAAKGTDRIVQFGTQQRSDKQFYEACMLVRNGRVGTLREIEVGLPTDPAGGNPAPMPVPPNLNYDAWLGWTPVVPYTEDRVHSQKDVNSRPGWLRCEQYCCGMITGWGVHHMDIAHWGMDAELTGPVEVSGKGEFPTTGLWTVHGPYRLELKYANGVTVRVCDRYPNGIKFIGSEGWIWVSRGAQKATSSDPTSGQKPLKALDASRPELIEKLVAPKVELYASKDHYGNWLDCIKTGKKPICPIDVGHRSTAVCNISHIAMRLGRTLKFDPAKEQFVGDDEANKLLTQPMREKYAV